MAERRDVPIVRARNRGQITTTLERYATTYRQRHPDRVTRYVYHPEHKPELSGVMARQAAGYTLVTYGDLGDEFKELGLKNVVRVADLVLMSIDRVTSRALAADNARRAHEAIGSVQSSYYEKTEQLGQAMKKEEHSRPGIRPVGSTVISERAFQYDIEQRSGGEDG